MEKTILPISEIVSLAKGCQPELISIGYEQASHNDEGLTDYDDAIRIYVERNVMQPAYVEFDLNSIQLLATMIAIFNRKAWQHNFSITDQKE